MLVPCSKYWLCLQRHSQQETSGSRTSSQESGCYSGTSSVASSPLKLDAQLTWPPGPACEEIELKCLFDEQSWLLVSQAALTCRPVHMMRAGPTLRKFWQADRPEYLAGAASGQAAPERADLDEDEQLGSSSSQLAEQQPDDEPASAPSSLGASLELVSCREISEDLLDGARDDQEERRLKQVHVWRRLLEFGSKLSVVGRRRACAGPFAIMISYQHAEARKYAISLKRALVGLGLSTYLDIDEIPSGSDWQDQLNTAVLGCSALVCLVTPSYGETLWTARELKLADLAGKSVLPVNFAPSWPPRSLAIQLASRQFIPAWLGAARPFRAGRAGPKWSGEDVRRVASLLGRALAGPDAWAPLDEATPLCSAGPAPSYAALASAGAQPALGAPGRPKWSADDSDASSSACSSLSSCHTHGAEHQFPARVSSGLAAGRGARRSLGGRAAKLLRKMRRKALQSSYAGHSQSARFGV